MDVRIKAKVRQINNGVIIQYDKSGEEEFYPTLLDYWESIKNDEIKDIHKYMQEHEITGEGVTIEISIITGGKSE